MGGAKKTEKGLSPHHIRCWLADVELALVGESREKWGIANAATPVVGVLGERGGVNFYQCRGHRQANHIEYYQPCLKCSEGGAATPASEPDGFRRPGCDHGPVDQCAECTPASEPPPGADHEDRLHAKRERVDLGIGLPPADPTGAPCPDCERMNQEGNELSFQVTCPGRLVGPEEWCGKCRDCLHDQVERLKGELDHEYKSANRYSKQANDRGNELERLAPVLEAVRAHCRFHRGECEAMKRHRAYCAICKEARAAGLVDAPEGGEHE